MKTYHDSDSVAIRESEKKGPDSSAVLVGSADNTGEMPEPPSGGTETPQPPHTNRGALITIPLANRYLFDWVAMTFKTTNPHDVTETIGLDSSLFIGLERGINGYRKSLRFGDIGIFYDGQECMGCHVLMSGQGCRLYEGQFKDNPWRNLFKKALSLNASFSRLDIACDNVDSLLDLDKLKDAIINHQIRSRFRNANENRNYLLGGDNDNGRTISLGKRSSRVYMRFYDKAAQMGTPLPWIRAEIELKKERAQISAIHFAEGMPIGQLFTGIMNEYITVINLDNENISRCSVQPWWSAWIQSTEKISLTTEKVIKTVDEVMEYVKRQYAPSIAMIKEHLGVIQFNEFMRDLITDGAERMGLKHEQILFLSSQRQADNYDATREDFEERAAIIEYDGGLDREEAERLAHALIDERDEP